MNDNRKVRINILFAVQEREGGGLDQKFNPSIGPLTNTKRANKTRPMPMIVFARTPTETKTEILVSLRPPIDFNGHHRWRSRAVECIKAIKQLRDTLI